MGDANIKMINLFFSDENDGLDEYGEIEEVSELDKQVDNEDDEELDYDEEEV